MVELDPRVWLLAPFVLLSFTTEATTGFGSIVIAVTLGANVLPIKEIVPVVVPLNLVLSGYIVARHHDHIAVRLLLTRILPLMALGAAMGLLAFHFAEGVLLKRLFGVLVVFFAVRELVRAARRAQVVPEPEQGPARAPRSALKWLLAAGVTHGMYAAGGPLLVYALSRVDLAKSAFRSTLATVWLTMNTAMLFGYVILGRIGRAELGVVGWLVPVVLVAIALGELLHHRIDENRYKVAIYAILVFAGGSLLWGSGGGT